MATLDTGAQVTKRNAPKSNGARRLAHDNVCQATQKDSKAAVAVAAAVGTAQRSSPTKRANRTWLQRLQRRGGAVGGAVLCACVLLWLVDDPPEDRVTEHIYKVAPPGTSASVANGRALAQELQLRSILDDIVQGTPNSGYVSLDPPIVLVENFMSAEECERIIAAGSGQLQPSLLEPRRHVLQPSVNVHRRDMLHNDSPQESRTSHTTWCRRSEACGKEPAVTTLEARMANLSGFPVRNFETLQIVRYRGPDTATGAPGDWYRAHSDSMGSMNAAETRVMTFFLYLNDVAAGGGHTWFPQAVRVNETVVEGIDYWRGKGPMRALQEFYRRALLSTADAFPKVGVRVRPRRGAALVWLNVEPDNVFQEEVKTIHAAEEVHGTREDVKWAANAWIRLYPFR